MKTDDKIRDENYNIISIEKRRKYQHYHQVKVTNTNIFWVRKYKQLKSTENNQLNLIQSLKKVYHLINKKKMFSKFSNLILERINTIEKLHNSLDFSNLIYDCRDPYENLNLTH